MRGLFLMFGFVTVMAAAVSGAEDVNDIGDYYGFGEMEIIKIDTGIKLLDVRDINGDGKNDILVVNNRQAKVELLYQGDSVRTEIEADPEQVNFLPVQSRFRRESVAVLQRIGSFVAGSFNEDDLMDFAYYGDPPGLYVLIQKQIQDSNNPQWKRPQKIDIPDGMTGNPNALVCGDLNGDGRDDLAVAAKDGVYFVYQQEDGGFSEPEKYPMNVGLKGIELSDIDSDGLGDLVFVTVDKERPLHIRFGMEGGKFGPLRKFASENPYVLTEADIDGNGKTDVVTIDQGNGRLIVYEFGQSETAGDRAAVYYPLPEGQGSNQRDLAVGDFDGDGLSDIIISDPGAAQLIYYSNRQEGGLSRSVTFPAYSDITNICAADIDDDGDDELAVISVKEKIVGVSDFEQGRLVFPEPLVTEGEPLAMEIADMDCDGEVDCVYVSVLEDEIQLRFIYAVSVDEGEPITGELSAAAREINSIYSEPVKLETPGRPDSLKILDIDNDGLNDVLVFIPYEPIPLVVRQEAPGMFVCLEATQSQASLLKGARSDSVSLADVHPDNGLEILVAQDRNFARALKFEQGKWKVLDQYNARDSDDTISNAAAIMMGDSNEVEIALLDNRKGVMQILKAGEDGIYRLSRRAETEGWDHSSHLQMVPVDVTDGEGVDILIFDGCKFTVIKGQAGDKGLGFEQMFNYATEIKEGVYGNLAVGDINCDGQTDLVMVEYKKNHYEILTLVDGEPVAAMCFKIFEEKSYSEQQQSRSTVEPREMLIEDVTGDGRADLVTLIHDRIIIYPQD